MERNWRVVATTLSFVVFGVWAAALTVTVAAGVALFVRARERRQRLARSYIRSLFGSFLSFIQFLGVVSLDIDERTRVALAAERGSVVVANHPSFIDVLVLISLIEQTNCVVKRALWHNPLLSWGVRLAGYIPSGEPEALFEACNAALRRNETVIVFPEATRTRPGEPVRLQRGAANIALHADAAIRLVRIRCEPPLLAKGVKWYQVPDTRPCLALRVGGSVRAREFLVAGELRNAAARRLTLVLQQELSRDISSDESPGAGTQAIAG